ncbi:MAG: hypothetical protein AAGU75_01290 [Bacillota bacterium]
MKNKPIIITITVTLILGLFAGAMITGKVAENKLRYSYETSFAAYTDEAISWLSQYLNDLTRKNKGEIIDETLMERSKVLAAAAVANMEQTAILLNIDGYKDLNGTKYILANKKEHSVDEVSEIFSALRMLDNDPYDQDAYEALQQLENNSPQLDD